VLKEFLYEQIHKETFIAFFALLVLCCVSEEGCMGALQKENYRTKSIGKCFSWKKNGQRFLKNYMLHFCAMYKHNG
jgi:hypothetical protein